MKVIIVDDEPDILEDIKDNVLEYEGFEVVGMYSNPFSVLEEFEQSKPECAFLDIEMPGMSGIDLAERLLALNPDIEIVFITAFNHYATQAFEVNAIDYILKPVHSKRFGKTMERLSKYQDVPHPRGQGEIEIRSFGCFEVLVDGTPIKWSRSKAKELLAYLLHFEGSKKTKYRICEDLWPEYEPKKALVNLQTVMCSLRKSLGAVGREDIKIEYAEESYVLILGNANWDVREFERLYSDTKSKPELAKQAVSLYQGDYAESEDWVWAQLTAESLARRYEELLMLLADISFQNGSYPETIETILKLAGRQAVDSQVQLLFVKAAYAAGGITGLKQNISLFRSICLREYDMDIEPEIYVYCRQNNVEI